MPRASTRKKVTTSGNLSLLDRLLKLNMVYVLGLLLIVASFLIGVLVTKVSYLEKNGGATTTNSADEQPAAATEPVDVSVGHLPVLGEKNAKVTIVEFADFQCPFCARYYEDVEKKIIEEYVNTGKAKFAFRHYAFLGQESIDAANATECANEQDKFWEYHNYLYENPGGENEGAFSKDNLKSFASTLGLDTQAFNECLDSARYQKNVDKDIEEGSKAGVDGTPATFINGVLISGAQPYSEFKKAIDNALSE
jgi:protein-disulfide isomerase